MDIKKQKTVELLNDNDILYRRFLTLYDIITDEVFKTFDLISFIKENNLIKDPTQVNVLLNNHNIEHIECVIARSSEILGLISEEDKLNDIEIYILLCSILFHDIGNLDGREQHELNFKVLMKYKSNISDNNILINAVKDVIRSHGGFIKGTNNKDKISIVRDNVMVQERNVRVHLLSAILRFSDELADNRNRTSDQYTEYDVIPNDSLLFHKYSEFIESCVVNKNKNIEITFNIPKKYLIETINDKYIIDYIYKRIVKMYLEKKYCEAFMKGYVLLNNIDVKIYFYNTEDCEFDTSDIRFTITDKMYPKNDLTIFDLCNDLTTDGLELNGEYYRKLYRRSIDE